MMMYHSAYEHAFCILLGSLDCQMPAQRKSVYRIRKRENAGHEANLVSLMGE